MGNISKLNVIANLGAENLGNGAGIYIGNEFPNIMSFRTITTSGDSLSITENSSQLLISGTSSDGSGELIEPTKYNSYLYSDIDENVLMYTGVVSQSKANNLKDGDGSMVQSINDINDVNSFDRDGISPIPMPTSDDYMVLLLPYYVGIEDVYDYYFNRTTTSRFSLTSNTILINDVLYNIYVTLTTNGTVGTISQIFGVLGITWENTMLYLTYNAYTNMVWRELKINDRYDSILSVNSVGKPTWGGLPRFPIIKDVFRYDSGTSERSYKATVSLDTHRIYNIIHNSHDSDSHKLLLNITKSIAGNYIIVTINNSIDKDVSLLVYINNDLLTYKDIYWSNIILNSGDEPNDDALVKIDANTKHTLYITCENVTPTEIFINTIKVSKINIEE